MSANPEWQLAFVLPNLLLGGRDDLPAELTLGLEGMAIVPASDPRVMEITDWSDAARRFLNSFHDGNGNAITPAVLIARDDWYKDMSNHVEPVIAFRNAVAIASILRVRARWPGSGWAGPSWSETFDHHPALLRLDGSQFDFWTPALNSIGFRLDELSLTPDLRVPRTDLWYIDDLLADQLGRVWHLRFRRRREMRKTARVFCSLEVAYEALSVGFKNYASLTETGLGTVPWTTAIEVLASPPDRDVRKWDCTGLIAQSQGFRDPELRHRKYWVKGRKGRRHSMTLAQKIFLHLYAARSKFVHGDKVSTRLLLPFGDDAPPLLSLASTIYRVALMAYLDEHWPREWRFDLTGMAYRDHLVKAVGKSPWD